MTPTLDDFRSSTGRRLPLRKRPDLVVSRLPAGRQSFWVLKDPVSLRYARLTDEEFGLWNLLDGTASLEGVKRDFERRFAPLQLSYPQLNAFLGDLHRKNLVLTDATGQGTELLKRERQTRRRELGQTLTSLLAIRLPGIDPEWLLNRLYPQARPFFRRWFVVFGVLLCLVAAGLAAVQFETLRTRLPTFQSFFSATNVVWIAVVLGGIKVLHELGHALTCRHFGGRCHELGLMLLVFVPCLYVNVSDAWTFSGKWRRIAVSAAGVAVELLLAAVCTLLWWCSQPGLVNTLCLNTMFVCSVSTLLFNGNPLLRYDGYYILADLLEMPNLWQESREYLTSIARRWCLGLESHEDLAWANSRRGWLAGYGVASAVYRVVVVVGILLFLFGVLRPYRLQVLAQAVLGAVVVGAIVMPVRQAWHLLSNPVQRRNVKRGRLGWSVLLIGGLAAGACCIPLPLPVTAPLVLEVQGAQRVYVTVAGELIKTGVEPGDEVAKGASLAQLENLELRRAVTRLEAHLEHQRVVVKNLEGRRGSDRGEVRLNFETELLKDLERRLAKTRAEADRLRIVAPADGRVLLPPTVEPEPDDNGRLPKWSGTPLDRWNVGSFLETGTPFCLIGDPNRLEAVLYVDQGDLELVQPGQAVRLRFDSLPGRVLTGSVGEISLREAKAAPREFSPKDLPVEPGADGVSRPVQPVYQVRVALDEHPDSLPVGGRGRGKILTAPQSLGRWAYRYLKQTFWFQPQ